MSLILLLVSLAAGSPAVERKSADTMQSPADYRRLSEETEANLKSHVLAKWYPAALDREKGGFHQNFLVDWKRGTGGERSLVYQSRLTWTAAQATLRYPADADLYGGAMRHGLTFLAEKLWDKEKGGFYWELDTQGTPVREKHTYGIAFGIYAASTVYQVSKDPAALDLAKRAFDWLDGHAHDAKNGGYFEPLTREGKPILTADGGSMSDAIGTQYGYKSQNTHIHLLEAFTALYEVSHDTAVKKRLDEVFLLVRDKIAVEPGCLNLFYTPDWRAVPGYDSFGHDVETAYLLVESAAILGRKDDAKTWHVARMLVDHALDYGWDTKNGGFYNEGTAFGRPTDRGKIWWVEAEGLNALLLLHEKYGKETPRYWEAFVKQWGFIQKHQVDATYGGWIPTVEEDGTPVTKSTKSDRWTEAYHQGRALLTVSAALARLARESR